MHLSLRSLCTAALFAATLALCSPPAVARDKFQYLVVDLAKADAGTPAQLEALLNRLGADGWELVQSSATGIAIFKREK
jgi:hypothetical protein